MKIISIITKAESIPNQFIIGETPKIITGTTVLDAGGPNIKSIIFCQEGAYSQLTNQSAVFKVFKGPCYIVSFVDSNIKRVIPMSMVNDIAVESDGDKKSTIKAVVENTTDETEAIPAS